MIKFGTGGWRGIIGDDFTKYNISLVAQALADRMHELGQDKKPVLIGHDRRFLSKPASKWIASVLAANGIKSLLMKRSSPTPLVMHMVMKEELEYGIEVTASHNPSDYNGIKIIVEEGRDAPTEVTKDLERRITLVEKYKKMDLEEAEAKGLVSYIKNPFNDYIDDILKSIDTAVIREKGPRILFNPMHGSAIYPFQVIFFSARCTLDLINDNKDAYFGGLMPAPNEETLVDLRDKVIKGHYDLGIAADGDGDRLDVIDSDGTMLSANAILVLLYYYLHEYKGLKGPVVRNLSTTHLLDRIAESFGEKCYEVPIGFKYVSAEIDRVDALIGGESSGGVTVRGNIHGKDSAYTAALFVEMMCRTGKQPTQLLKEIEDRFGHREFVEYNAELSAEKKEKLLSVFSSEQGNVPSFDVPYTRLNYIDGCKVYFPDDSYVICRPSGTENLLRFMAEAPTEEKCWTYINAWREFVDKL